MRRLASRHERSENFIERSLEIQEFIDKGQRAIDDLDIDKLYDLNLIDKRTFREWENLEAEHDELSRYEDFTPSLTHYEDPLDMAERKIKTLEKEVKNLISKSRNTLRLASSRTAASGNYGYTKAVQNDVEVALRKLEKKVGDLARAVENKHPEAGTYFGTRCQGSTCNASKALSGACLLNQKPKRVLTGPLGFKPACAKASHKAITDLILHAGDVAHTLYKKDRDHIPYLKTHAKKKRCPLTRLLLENYPVEIL